MSQTREDLFLTIGGTIAILEHGPVTDGGRAELAKQLTEAFVDYAPIEAERWIRLGRGITAQITGDR